ncbi:MAG: beta strand repeat-containing protein, partial [Candidatus Hinthialibacter sp.]
ADIDANVVTATAGVGIGGATVGVGASIGVSVARNFIGWKATDITATYSTSDAQLRNLQTNDTVKIASGARAGDVYKYLGDAREDVNLSMEDYGDQDLWEHINLEQSANEVQAYVENSSIIAGGNLTQTADSEQNIDAIVFSGSAAVSGGAIAGVSVSGAGSGVVNRIASRVRAFIDGDGANDINAGGISLSAVNHSTINAISGAASVAAAFSGVAAVSVSLGAGVAINEISNDVKAFIQDVDAHLRGSVSLKAEDASTITSTVFAASMAISGGLAGAAVSLSVSVAENTIENDVQAWIQNASVNAGGDVSVQALEEASINATSAAAGVGVSISIGAGVSAGGAWSVVTVQNTTKAFVDSSSLILGGDLTISATDSADAKSDVVAASLAGGLVAVAVAGSISMVTITPAVEARVINSSIRAAEVKINADSAIVSHATGVGAAVGAGIGAAAAGTVSEVNLGRGNSVYEIVASIDDGANVNDRTVIEAEKLDITAVSSDDLFAESYAGSGSVVAGAGSESTVSTDNSTLAYIGDYARLAVGTFVLTSDHNQDVDSKADAYTLALAAGTGAVADNTITGKANIEIGANASVTAGNIYITAVNRLTKQKLEADENNLRSGSAALANVTVLHSGTDIGTEDNPLETVITVGDGATLIAEGINGGEGRLDIQAYNNITAVDSVRIEAVSIVASAAVGLSRIDAQTDVRIDIDGATLENKTGDVYLTTRSSVSLYPSANLLVASGLTGVGSADASSTIHADN